MPAPTYHWEPQLARYRDVTTGRLVPPSQVRRAVDRALRFEYQRARDLADQWRVRAITTREFDLGMREVVKNTQLFSAAAARGGWQQMDARAFGQVGAQVRQQYAFLRQFTAELQAGLPMDGQQLNRAASYANAGVTTYHVAQRDVQLQAGQTQERSIKHPGDHCQGCVDQEALGWQPIGVITPLGERDCLNNCNCTMEYR